MARDDNGIALAALGVSIWSLLNSAAGKVGQVAGQAISALGIVDPGLVAHLGGGFYRATQIQDGTATTVANRNGVAGDPQVNVTIGVTAGTVADGADTRFAPIPLPIDTGKFVVNNLGAYIERNIVTSDIPTLLDDKTIRSTVAGNWLLVSKNTGTAGQVKRIYLGPDGSNDDYIQTINATIDATGNVYTKDLQSASSRVLKLGNSGYSLQINSDPAVLSWGLTTATQVAIFGRSFDESLASSGSPQVCWAGDSKIAVAPGELLYVFMKFPRRFMTTIPIASKITLTPLTTVNIAAPTTVTLVSASLDGAVLSFPATAAGLVTWSGSAFVWNT